MFLWGLPSYYPKLGFVPLLPRDQTKINHQSLRTVTNPAGKFKEGAAADQMCFLSIYNHYNQSLWLQPQREVQWWEQRLNELNISLAMVKEVPYPKTENLLLWENKNGNSTGYLNFSCGPQKILISEALAYDLPDALMMLEAFLTQYVQPDQTLFIRGTPEHPVQSGGLPLGRNASQSGPFGRNGENN